MRRIMIGLMMAVTAIVLFGNGPVSDRTFASDRSERKKEAARREAIKKDPLAYRMVGDRTGVDGMRPVRVEGIGLLINLHGTGSDPPLNVYRERMTDFMQKLPNPVRQPARFLASPSTAIVLLRAHIPSGARKGDQIDVEVWVPPGDVTTSLKGGKLLPARLSANLVARNELKKGDELIEAMGPVLVTGDPSNPEDAASLRRGMLLGGGRVLADHDFRIAWAKADRAGSLKQARRSQELARRINLRFATSRFGPRQGLATAKNDKFIELKLADEYRYDIQRYLHVVRRVPVSTSETFTRTALQILEERLLRPTETLEAALRLEAIGKPAIPVLMRGLKSSKTGVRFASAQSLAYLGDASGLSTLAHLAEHEPAYRAYALTAMIALDRPASRAGLTRLLHARSAETRYGAFRALWSFDKLHPEVRGKNLNNQFYLHKIDSEAEPMVHVARSFRPEVVLFGAEQRIQTPLSLRAGEFITLHNAADDRILLASFRPGRDEVRERRAESSLLLADVIEAAAKLGATYPDIVDMLQQAARNGNLSGRLEINALPEVVRLSTLDRIAGSGDTLTGPSGGPIDLPSLFASPGDKRAKQALIAPPEDGDFEDKPTRAKGGKRRSVFDFFRRSGN